MAQENVPTVDLRNGGTKNGCSKAVSFSALKPQLVVQAPKAAEAVQFYKAAFGAEELKRSMHPKRKADQELPLILSAELKLGSSVLLVCDQTDECVAKVKGEEKGSGCILCLETDNVETAVANAVKAGGVIIDGGELTDGEGACCGGRVGKVKDPYGYVWLICSPGKMCTDVEG
ncbi:hypothetical protein HHK36_013163 [Tetracentron sinense]|uniref:VOC domain-containing protein n=1 Tax=Tetracentron sinense TaxID=13715 RepID=A0A835DGC5_TETSI|nr:hypothetical protein HHK36_013163 [Tetracentron sinense]